MISFRHGEQTVNLPAGDLWAAGIVEETYRDTSAEELWAIVHEVEQGTPWREAVGRRYAQSNPWLHRIVTSPDRDLFFRLHPPPSGACVLDIGAGWGQISLPLARACEVTAIEPTPERLAFIRAAATQEGVTRRLHFVQADFFDVEFLTRFDLVTCIGVLEWVPKFRAGDPREVQIDFLRRVRALLNPGGRLVVGIENRLGLKYLLGAPDDHLGVSGVAVLDAKTAARRWLAQTGQPLRSFTFTRFELTEILAAAGFASVGFYAALPDYKVPEHIIPLEPPGALDQFFLHGNFVNEHNGANGCLLDIQDELRSHYRSLAQLGISQALAPSFFVSAS
jgi:2-polyprenyl-3-methyl-5-hydroxy-6-metoxy-1,4-benzoquinol methylase